MKKWSLIFSMCLLHVMLNAEIIKLHPIDSGIAIPGYIQGRVSFKDNDRAFSKEKISLQNSSGKCIDSTTTDSNGFFRFVVPEKQIDENYYVVYEGAKKKTRFHVYRWHKTKVLTKNGIWIEVNVKYVRRKKITRYFHRRVMGCPKFS